MEEIPIAEHGISRAIFSTLLNYPVPNRNGKIMLTIYRNKISKLTYIYGIIPKLMISWTPDHKLAGFKCTWSFIPWRTV